jgi:hypothetical protein
MKLEKFNSPGNLKELNEVFAQKWSNYISKETDTSINGYPAQRINDDPREMYINQTKIGLETDSVLKDIFWIAFPRNILISTIGDRARWKKADSSRDVQDEYCEWSVERNPANDKITRIEFTCEDVFYWHHLWAQSPQLVTDLYKKHVNGNVVKEDLENPDGSYNPKNKWNNNTMSGAMHMIQINNTINAAIELAAGATNIRVINGKTLTGEQELIMCGKYGDSQRNSDPHIGAIVNSLTRQKAQIAIADPIGLYFDKLITNGWETPDGTNPSDFWSYTRGSENMYVRAVYEVPSDKNYDVGDITINGKKIEFGSQIADFISIKLVGVATRIGKTEFTPITACTARKPQDTNQEKEKEVIPFYELKSFSKRR